MRFTRASIAVLVVSVALLCAIGGIGTIALFAPFLAVAALLVSGRFFGEERILAFHRAHHTVRARRVAAPRWRPETATRARSLFARSPRTFRGPPALLSF
jgi:hypothetical protein